MKLFFTIALLLLCLGIKAQSRDTLLTYRLDKAAIRKVLANTSASTVVLEIFPLKRSNIVTKPDFDLLLHFKDTICGLIYPNQQIPLADFEQQTVNYIGYLQANNIPLQNMPVLYHNSIARQYLAAADHVDISILSPGLAPLVLFFKSATPAPIYLLSCCKCPPLTICCRSPQASTVEDLLKKSVKAIN